MTTPGSPASATTAPTVSTLDVRPGAAALPRPGPGGRAARTRFRTGGGVGRSPYAALDPSRCDSDHTDPDGDHGFGTGARAAPGGRPRDGRHRGCGADRCGHPDLAPRDRKSTRLNSSHANISYAVFCLKKKKKK